MVVNLRDSIQKKRAKAPSWRARNRSEFLANMSHERLGMFFYTNAVGDGLLTALGAFDRIRRARYVLSVGLQLKSGVWQWKLRVTDGVRDPEDTCAHFLAT